MISPSPETTKSAPDSQVLFDVGSRLGTANDGPPTSLACYAQNLDDILAGHQVGINAED